MSNKETPKTVGERIKYLREKNKNHKKSLEKLSVYHKTPYLSLRKSFLFLKNRFTLMTINQTGDNLIYCGK